MATPEEVATALQGQEKIKNAKTTGVNPTIAAQALANQTGGNIMGFTYE
jgi:hypothetical protein